LPSEGSEVIFHCPKTTAPPLVEALKSFVAAVSSTKDKLRVCPNRDMPKPLARTDMIRAKKRNFIYDDELEI
jgi:hypothetical protein